MSAYKIIYRNSHPDWQEGCPIKIEAIQVSRNTESGVCFLQTKLTNISNADVHAIEFNVVLSNDEGDSETVDFQLLDADLPAGETLTPEAKKLSLSEVTDSATSITRVDEEKSFAAGIQIMDPEPVELSKELLEERNALLEEQGTDPKLNTGMHRKHNGWWQCGCGTVNVARSTCWKCHVSLDLLDKLNFETELIESHNSRLYNEAASKLKSRSRPDIEQSVKLFGSLSEESYKDSRELLSRAKEHLKEVNTTEIRRRKQLRIIALAVVLTLLVGVSINQFVILPQKEMEAKREATYNKALNQIELKDFDKAQKNLESLDGYKDSKPLLKDVKKSKRKEKNALLKKWYKQGLKALEGNDYSLALTSFENAADYSDAKQQVSKIKQQIKQHPFSLPVGQHAEFGKTEQDGDTSDGTEALQWKILAKDDSRALVVTDEVIDYRPYNSDRSKGSSWESCDLRDYLNSEFKNSVFSEEERSKIDGDIFIPDLKTIEQYMPAPSERSGYPTQYVSSKLSNTQAPMLRWWTSTVATGWTESSGNNGCYLVVVDTNGSAQELSTGEAVDQPQGVRPMMWVEI